MTVEELKTALGTDGLLIKSERSGSLSYENGSWNGTLSSIVPGEMYRIQTSASCSLVLSGSYASEATVTLLSGYNWVGYPGLQPLAIADLGITPAEGDKIDSQDEGYAIYENGTWKGTLATLQPGRGYVYLSNATGSKTLVFQ